MIPVLICNMEQPIVTDIIRKVDMQWALVRLNS